MNENPGNNIEKTYRKPVRVFEKSGSVNPEMSYYTQLEKITGQAKFILHNGTFIKIRSCIFSKTGLLFFEGSINE